MGLSGYSAAINGWRSETPGAGRYTAYVRLVQTQARYQAASTSMAQLVDIGSISHADAAKFCEWSHPIGPVVQLVNALHLVWHWRRGTDAGELPPILRETPAVSSSTWRLEAWDGALPMLVRLSIATHSAPLCSMQGCWESFCGTGRGSASVRFRMSK
jgi:hypothetical protein